MKYLLAFLIYFTALTNASAQFFPTDSQVLAYRTRCELYTTTLHQSPAKTVVSLRNYYGRNFGAKYNYGDNTTDIFVYVGEGTSVRYMQIICSVSGS